jgi:transposase-like protein
MSDAEHIQEIASVVMRANGTKVFTVKCTACGKEHTQNLRWLQTKRFICPSCGGKLDDFPLHQLTLSAMRELKKGAKSQKKKISKQAATVLDKKLDIAKSYQLVLQFRGGSLDDFDAMVALEEELTEELGDSADVDGHDAGSDERNIFIFTSDPKQTFQQARTVLERRQSLQEVTAAFRPVDGERYTVIWPEGSRKAFVVA